MVINQPISLHAGALNGSNTSMAWNFLSLNTSFVFEVINNSMSAKVLNVSNGLSNNIDAVGVTEKYILYFEIFNFARF